MKVTQSSLVVLVVLEMGFLCQRTVSDEIAAHKYTTDSPQTKSHCDVNSEGKDSCNRKRRYTDGLYRWDPVKIGHVREIIVQGVKKKLITKALEPPVFEIPDFLSGDECKHIKQLAVDNGLIVSETHVDEERRKFNKRREMDQGMKDYFAAFAVWDLNKDNMITKEEMRGFIQQFKNLYFKSEDIEMMIDHLDFHEVFEDGVITYDEWSQVPIAALDEFLYDVHMNDPRHMHRYSQQTWLHHTSSNDLVLKGIRNKVIDVTKLHPKIIDGAEPLQVLRYGPRGHYHAHYDSQTTNDTHLKCCHFVPGQTMECRLCRYMTIFYYLNNVEDGGETAFPVADKENFNETVFRERKGGDLYNLNHHCYDAPVVVAPKRGTAIMWYNHYLDEEGKWLGAMDERSLHGGCEVRKGVKWAANNWITAPQLDTIYQTSKYLRHKRDDHDDEEEEEEEMEKGKEEKDKDKEEKKDYEKEKKKESEKKENVEEEKEKGEEQGEKKDKKENEDYEREDKIKREKEEKVEEEKKQKQQ